MGENSLKYLKEIGRMGSCKLFARARCGNVKSCNRYWLTMSEEKTNCKLSKRRLGTLGNLSNEYEELESSESRMEMVLN